jgi:uroporphyrinogen III methyltransferase/synthase
VSSGRGRVHLVGAGPGDPGLLTLRAAELLRGAEVLLYDALVSDSILALAPSRCERIFVGKRRGMQAMPQDAIARLMIEKAQDGKSVVRLKGGDPFIFGRGGEEGQALRAAGVDFDVAPGVSSALAAPAYAGIPLTHREFAAAFTVITGHEDPTKPASTLDWAKLADPARTLVLMMATASLGEIARQLMTHGLSGDTPVAVVQDGTRPTQRTITGTLHGIAEAAARMKVGSPAVVVVGEVVRLREELRWFDVGPLFGKRVLITRMGHQSSGFARALLERGAEPIVGPTIDIQPADEPRAADEVLDALPSFAWIVFTSQNGVDAFFERLSARNADARAIGNARVAAIGEPTAQRLREHGICPDLVPSDFIGEAVARLIIATSHPGDRVLVYRAAEARDVLPRMLEESGRHPTVVAAYKTVVARDAEFQEKVARANVLTFTSASTVRGFVALLTERLAPAAAAREKCVACIGPITAAAARDAGLHVDVVASTYTTQGLLDALESYFSQRR